ncbi:protein norD [Rhodomicrobium udaipurense JA643]|uniref:VWA domain-containing protein n=1 Tax=Rhodomicrobium udaipurense TaxID=1202716 RepID=A0A8I1GIB0_9HYPH|nr:VWA domain-containing protein [Rhodomicrobium udaipurense]KAI96135.1 protein norD [Rhodomicrobium udaipurense JA643]MBJ7544220.1 VWA domain-containing protein [Rhodomicrobium udaipurense]
MQLLELEETVGRFWHSFAGNTRTWPRFEAAAVKLEDMQSMLAVCFRGFGGDATVQLVGARERTSGHRLRMRQRLGLGEEKLVHPARDEQVLMLPPVIDLLPDQALNRDLYLWLAAAMATMRCDPVVESDPLRRDLERLQRGADLGAAVIEAFPGMEPRCRRLCAALLAVRKRGKLPRAEQMIEDRVINLLREGAGLPPLSRQFKLPVSAPPGYLPMLPVPLWPEALLRGEADSRHTADEPASGGACGDAPAGRHTAVREKTDTKKNERSPFILNRFEKILAMAEMVNVNRPADDSDDDDASAADDLDEITLGERKGRPSSRFRFDLDLPPEALDRSRLTADLTYPEWDYRSGTYLKDYCRVLVSPAPEAEGTPQESDETRRLIRRVRRQFEVLRPKREWLCGQIDGAELDLDALVRRHGDLSASGDATDRIYRMHRPLTHDFAVTLLVDVSLSTDAWFDNLRVLDVEKEAVAVLAEGLAACGDNHSILTFTSRRRNWVRVETVKDFREPMSGAIRRRIEGLKPGFYTRIGPAIRHATAKLGDQPNRRRLLLVLTDGKPNDVDHYEGRFALEDTRRAVMEASRRGVRVFAVTIDRDAKSYVPAIFGQNGYAAVPHVSRLPAVLPAIYRGLTG